MMDDYSPEPKWYVAHTYSGYENKVKESIEMTVRNRGLEEQILGVEVPLERAVEVKNGTKKTVVPPVRRLGFGDIVSQGLPFYTGNVIYSFRIKTSGAFRLRVPMYRGGLVKVFIDGKDAGNIAFSPYILDIDAASSEHRIDVRLYGTRRNGFAQLHHTSGIYFYQSPNSRRSAGDRWCYEYQFKQAGILKSPEIYGAKVILESGGTRSSDIGSEHMTDRN